ncbi:TetR family transcriptional regulator [Amycolatopsis pithecellobii]|uniref:TetR family transcriptional regulator n=1 Tax=Amycolatopsis pithecellobii TaxID=664692 RepID=A0A6N7YLJ3_9PSEU|nr:TetR family transcriptional regulator [Amycolatopsis pithecellobii]MTD52892.1 TetR family transcriptional regulator [Amycolatopsis pithecellobii]
MPRWEPGSTERMQRAALELFAEQGFEKTTVNEIAARAGVTRRTFFRHFSDKREVLFSASVTDFPETALVEGIARADGSLMPLQMIMSASAAYDWDTLGPRDLHRQRHAVIAANPELMERQLIKYEASRVAFAEALLRRGFDADAANLAADVGGALVRSAYERWLDAGDDTTMAQIIEDIVATLRTALAADVGGRFLVF